MIRVAQKKIQKFLNQTQEFSPVLIVQGARQVGKTYMIVQELSTRECTFQINLEKQPDIKLRIDQTKNFDEFTKLLRQEFSFSPSNGNILFIDEAQESETLGRYVRFMKEDWAYTKVILSGSSMQRLFAEDVRVPVGRIEYLIVHPFSFREFLRFLNKETLLDEAAADTSLSDWMHQSLMTLYDDYIHFGGMPEAVKAYNEGRNPDDILSFLIAAQRDDFLRKEDVKSYLFLDALKGVANHIGSTSKYTHVSDNHYDAKKILQKLLQWFLVYEIDVKGSLSTQTFWPKRYLYDVGILRFLRDTAIPRISLIHTLDEALRTPLGGLVENACLIKLLETYGGYAPLSAWKKNNKEAVEVDFIVKHESQTLPIEIKASLKVNSRHAKNVEQYCDKFRVPKGYIVSFDKPSHIISTGKFEIRNIPAYLFGEVAL